MEYKVKNGFMAFQFDKPTYCIGIEVNAIHKAKVYDCIIGKGETKITISYSDCLSLVEKYGEDRILRKIRGKNVFIVPVKEFVKTDNSEVVGS